jgi:hypothetical protein
MGALKYLLALAGLAGMALASVGAAHAQLRSEPPLNDAEGGLILTVEGYELWLPAPGWLDPATQQSGSIVPEVNAVFRSGEGEALLEIYPDGEGEALWSTLYGVRISTGSAFTLKDYRDAVMSGFARNCDPAQLGFFQLGPDNGDTLAPLGYVCGAFAPRLRTYRGLGEVMVMSFRKEGDAVALIFQQWRGEAFDPTDPASWPVETRVVEARARQLQDQPRLQRAD